jgi:hypothetical protein
LLRPRDAKLVAFILDLKDCELRKEQQNAVTYFVDLLLELAMGVVRPELEEKTGPSGTRVWLIKPDRGDHTQFLVAVEDERKVSRLNCDFVCDSEH